MPFGFERDYIRRRVVFTYRGSFQVSEALASIERRRGEVWSYGVLYDLRGMSGRPTAAELRALMSEEAPNRGDDRAQGPVAFLVTDQALYNMTCTYAAMGHSKDKDPGVS